MQHLQNYARVWIRLASWNPTVFASPSATADGAGEREGTVFQQLLDLLKRDAQELERGNLFQTFEILQAVEARPGCSALGLEQTDAIVVVQRSNGHPGQFREFANAVAHGSTTIFPLIAQRP